MRNQKGITLVALVVTIVVLLILAGTSIAMLSGDNGILTNAQKSTYANTEGEVMDKIRMAYNTVKTEIIAKSATISTYKATDHIADLANVVAKDLGGEGKISDSVTEEVIGSYTVAVSGLTITITYDDGKTFTDGGDQYQEIPYVITVTAGNATLGDYTPQVIQ